MIMQNIELWIVIILNFRIMNEIKRLVASAYTNNGKVYPKQGIMKG